MPQRSIGRLLKGIHRTALQGEYIYIYVYIYICQAVVSNSVGERSPLVVLGPFSFLNRGCIGAFSFRICRPMPADARRHRPTPAVAGRCWLTPADAGRCRPTPANMPAGRCHPMPPDAARCRPMPPHVIFFGKFLVSTLQAKLEMSGIRNERN